MRLREALSLRIRELRKWDLAPLGAVLVVVVLGVLAYLFIATGGGPGNEALIRGYFASPRGGGATQDQVEQIEVGDCQPTESFLDDNIVWVCEVTFHGKTYQPCFAWTGDRVIAGSRELGADYGCQQVVWSRAVRTLIPL